MFMKKFPGNTVYAHDFDRGYVQNIPNRFLFDWFRIYGYENWTQERSVTNLNNYKKMYVLCSSEYGSYDTTVVIEIKSRRCKKTDRYARKNYKWNEWHQYGYVVWRETKDGDYVEEFSTHYEHILMKYLLSINLNKYA